MYILFHNFLENSNNFFRIFNYTTTRCGIAVFMSFCTVMLLMPTFIKFCKKIQNGGQPIRLEYTPEQASKVGTPTAGGVLMIFSIVLTTLLCGNLTKHFCYIPLFSMLLFGAVGFLDDFKKLKHKNSNGISGKLKLLFQVLIATVAVILMNQMMDNYDYSSKLTFPFFRRIVLDIGILYTLFRIFVIVGSSNAVNLTDGLDGLAIIPIIFVCAVMLVFGYVIGNIGFSHYLFMNYYEGSNEICVFLSACIGAGLGFLWFNAKPAQIFMGDTGSLAFGGTLGVISCMLKSEFVFAIAGFIFVMETLSDIIQVVYFKTTHGKRIFKMAPIHHHFIKSGWSETQVVIRFWIISIFFCLIALSSLKIR